LQSTERLLKVLDEDGPRLHRLLFRLTLRAEAAEDLLQDLFVNLSQSAGFAEADSPTAFAVRTIVNLAFDWRRRQSRRIDAMPLDNDIAGRPADPLGGLIDQEQMQQVLNAIEALPENQRLVLILRHLEHQEPEEIGKNLGRTPHQVRALCAKGIATLRASLGGVAQKEMSDG
jgi:RNA polymerase sigma-70 factor, ECF subfamily